MKALSGLQHFKGTTDVEFRCTLPQSPLYGKLPAAGALSELPRGVLPRLVSSFPSLRSLVLHDSASLFCCDQVMCAVARCVPSLGSLFISSEPPSHGLSRKRPPSILLTQTGLRCLLRHCCQLKELSFSTTANVEALASTLLLVPWAAEGVLPPPASTRFTNEPPCAAWPASECSLSSEGRGPQLFPLEPPCLHTPPPLCPWTLALTQLQLTAPGLSHRVTEEALLPLLRSCPALEKLHLAWQRQLGAHWLIYLHDFAHALPLFRFYSR
jgi:hypothetical protein